MVERSEIDQMAKYMAALNNPGGAISEHRDAKHRDGKPGSIGSGDPKIAEMKLILERFHSATDTVISEAPYDRALRDSLNMELTETGVKYGNWEIVVKKIGKRSLYDVIHMESREKIASDLMLYEAAVGLARHLNEDKFVNSRELLEMLRHEQDYASAVNDMVIYKHHLTKTPRSPRKPIYEARYDVAKRKAITARNQVYKLSERL